MPIRWNDTKYEIQSLTIDGCEFLGIEEFTMDDDAYVEYSKNEIERSIRLAENNGTLIATATFRFDKIIFWKLVGLWDWAIKNCPNKRVVHLMKYSKSERIKIKNFYRAVHITCVLIAQYKDFERV